MDPEFISEIAPRLIAAGLILLFALPFHEFSHALAAYRLGDSTAKLLGRLTLNPVAHFDPLGGMLLIISSVIGVGIGWAKPTPVNPSNLEGGRYGDAIVAMAGPLSNLVLAVVAALPFRYIVDSGLGVPTEVLTVLLNFIYINVALCLFNLLPIVPLDGSHVLFALMSPATAWRYRPVITQYGPIMLLVAAFLPILPGGHTIFGFVFDQIGVPIVAFLVGA